METQEYTDPCADPRVPIFLVATDQKTRTPGYIMIRHWTNNRAKKKGIRWFLFIYGVGIFSYINPALHFIVPPIWTVAGPYIGYKIYKLYNGVVEIHKGRGHCPYCHQEIRIYPLSSKWPFPAKCPKCYREYLGHRQLNEAGVAEVSSLT